MILLSPFVVILTIKTFIISAVLNILENFEATIDIEKNKSFVNLNITTTNLQVLVINNVTLLWPSRYGDLHMIEFKIRY